MYKLMIVEDEALVREAVLKMIDFQSQGFEVVAVCEDGQQAVEQYERLDPDLVITDICMPFISGLELAAKIAEADRGTQVIILTGFDDFNYAKLAIKSQVANYLLKPLTPSEFEDVLAEARRKLDEKQLQQRQIHEAQRQLHKSSPIVRDQLFNRLIQGAVDLDEIRGDLNQSGLDFQLANFQLAIVQIDDLDAASRDLRISNQLLQFMVANVAAELAGTHTDCLAFQLADGRSALIGGMDDSLRLSLMMRNLGHQIQDAAGQVLKIRLTIGGGNIVQSAASLKDSFSSAQRCLDYKFLMPDQAIIFPEDIHRQAQTIDISELEDKIILQVRLRDENKIIEAIDQLVQAVRLTVRSKTDIQFEWTRLSSRLLAAVRNESVGFEPELDQTLPNASDTDYLDRLRTWLVKFCLDIVENLRGRRKGETQRLSVLACQYIRDHYADSQLSLLEVCNHTSVSLSHFSQLFKEETGKTFVEYLTEIRMEKAQELLRTTSRMLYDIAGMVGYDSPAYFTVAFKKYVGISPRDYRKQFEQDR